MTNWKLALPEMVTRVTFNSFELPEELFTWLKEACEEAKQKGNTANNYLVGHIKEEHHLIGNTPSGEQVYFVDINKNFINFLLQCTTSKLLQKHLNKINCLSSNKPLYLHDLWVNHMKKHEFNPPHSHSGALSFVIFIKIPYDLKAEEDQFPLTREMTLDESYNIQMKNHTSKFAFLNTRSDGTISVDCINVDKSFEGKMLMFPSPQIHQVFPFYTSDDYRITVSGNIRIKV